MKRHQALAPLSRDHHDGLLLAVRLQQGKQALPRLWSHDPLWQADYVVKFYDRHLVPHFEAEEKVLFPVAARYMKEGNVIIRQLLHEHEEMRTSIKFFRHPEEEKLERNLEQFGKLLESHIRCEEREFFPMCEEIIPEEEFINAQSFMVRYDKKGNES